MPNVYRATQPFIAFSDGIPRVIKIGDPIVDDDPAYQGREEHFEPMEVAAARYAGVESTTAAPGELRSVSTVPKEGSKRRGRPRKQRAPKQETDKPDKPESDTPAEEPEEPKTEEGS